jgi:hypothetical protein
MSILRAWTTATAGYLLAFLCLFWVFHKFNFTELLRRVGDMNLFLVGAAIVCDVTSYVCQGARWQILLRPVSRVTLIRATQAIYAGLFVNEVLPLHLGEVARGMLISRWTSAKPGSILASMLMERLWDGLWLAVCVVFTIALVPLPRRLVDVGDVFALAILIGLVVFTLLVFTARTEWSNNSAPERRGLAHRVIEFLRRAAFELRVISSTRNVLVAGIFSLVMLLLQGLSFWLVMRAYGLHLSFPAGLAVFTIVHLGTIVPGAGQCWYLPVFYYSRSNCLWRRQNDRGRFFCGCVQPFNDTALGHRLRGFWE